MTHSAAELSALVLKAARGAGVPLGIAEDLSRAVPWILGTSAGLDQAVTSLRGNHDRVVLTEDPSGISVAGSSTIMMVPTATDALLAGAPEVRIQSCEDLELVIAFLCALPNTLGRPFKARMEAGSVLITRNRVSEDQLVPRKGAQIASEILENLELLAAKTYVPATAQSRLTGAGAGLTDND